jgi:hypothetical protein
MRRRSLRRPFGIVPANGEISTRSNFTIGKFHDGAVTAKAHPEAFRFQAAIGINVSDRFAQRRQ